MEHFFENFLNRPHYILGKQLQPFCLNHLIALHAIESPLVYTDKPLAFSDIEIAVFICSGGNIFNLKQFSFWRLTNKLRSFDYAVKQWLSYQADFLMMPRMWENGQDNSKDCGIHWILLYASVLIKNTGWTEEKILSMPIGRVIEYSLTLSYLESGDSNILTDTDAAAMELLKKHSLT